MSRRAQPFAGARGAIVPLSLLSAEGGKKRKGKSFRLAIPL
jgi:hypothetical protein